VVGITIRVAIGIAIGVEVGVGVAVAVVVWIAVVFADLKLVEEIGARGKQDQRAEGG
jgi:hypothetical protein